MPRRAFCVFSGTSAICPYSPVVAPVRGQFPIPALCPTMRFKAGVGNLSQRVATFAMARAGSLRFSEGQPCIPSRTSGEHGVSTPISRVLIFTFCSQKDVCLFTGEGYSNHCPKGTEDKTKQRLPRERHAMRRFSKCFELCGEGKDIVDIIFKVCHNGPKRQGGATRWLAMRRRRIP